MITFVQVSMWKNGSFMLSAHLLCYENIPFWNINILYGIFSDLIYQTERMKSISGYILSKWYNKNPCANYGTGIVCFREGLRWKKEYLLLADKAIVVRNRQIARLYLS